MDSSSGGPRSAGIAGQRALLRFLQRQGRVTGEDAQRLEHAAAEAGKTIHELLVSEGLLNEEELATLLASSLKLTRIDLGSVTLETAVVRTLKESAAAQHEVIPLRMEGNTLELAMVNPLDLDAVKAVEFATGKRVQAVVSTRSEIREAIKQGYRIEESLDQFLSRAPETESVTLTELEDPNADLRTIARDADLPPVVKLADLILVEGVKGGASDVHIEPTPEGALVRYRIDGILEEGFRFPKWVQQPMIARFKVMAKLDIAERRVPQDGRLQVRWQGRNIDFRVSSLPTQHGEKITLRILDATKAVRSLEELGFLPTDLRLLREAVNQPQGMVLVTGPTGSGKTTTLYALIREIFSPTRNIITIENPIEYQLKGINQVEINDKQGLNFAGVLRSVLRQDPDVILIGEIRDAETARIAFQASQTGHLVLSTLHTNDAAATITRLIDLKIEPYVVASSVNLLAAQRLVRRICSACTQPYDAPDDMVALLHLEDDRERLRRGIGCNACRQAGYTGRLGVYEVIPVTAGIGRLIETQAAESEVRRQARLEGRSTLREDALEKVRTGVTTVDEVLRVIQIAPESAVDLEPVPAAEPAGGGSATAATGKAAPAPATPRRTFKALVVDDEPTLRHIVRLMLETSKLGLTVMTAQDGPEALSLAAVERPDIVILDRAMPGMDGFEVCRRLRQDPATAFVPVLMLTAHDAPELVEQGFEAGADDYVVKPVKREILAARVRRMLERTYGKDAVPAADAPAGAPPARTDP